MEESPNPTSQIPNPENSTTPSVNPPVSNPSKPRNKLPLALIIGIVLFLLIAGSAAGFYVLKPQIMKLVSKPIPTTTPKPAIQTPPPTHDPTANWKTYTNKKLGFLIRYPADSLIDANEICTNKVDYLGLYSKKSKKEIKDNPNLFCVVALPELRVGAVFSNKLQEKSDEYWKVDTEQFSIGNKVFKKYISTRTEKAYEGINSPFKKTVQIEINKSGQKYSISYGFPMLLSEELINQILSTFQFTD